MTGPAFPTVWITGASSGIGQTLARLLADEGSQVCLTARPSERLEAAVAGHPHFHGQPADVSDVESLRAAYDRIMENHGLPDLVIFNAAIYQPGPTSEINPEDAAKQIATNLTGVVNGVGSILPAMLERGRGRIAIVGSVAGYRGLPNAGIYGATKAALISYAESLHGECRDRGVQIQIINPGFVETPMTAKNDFPMPFLITADQAAQTIRHGLNSKRFEIAFPAKFVWILKALAILPYGLFFPLTRRLTGTPEHHDNEQP
ncbi:SDR family NAD(P)-dependent oxidoreductase [Aestuariispira insulae]|uniref:Short-subunit dehydrogenase n=1 Tax=Aestuariispira insulae TaxID=1461337 RepID=A0A3D9H8I8_9PROT|nr:SDR family NAD(P)-dependent oxidoreductase [Aestuariispira insulae]RED45795.1 short-subunit dehydrogenase [Aestuariispira insulae]